MDQHSNNVTLFNLVEQINLRPNSEPPPGTLVPVEIHAYFQCDARELSVDFEVRFALVSLETGLESLSDVFVHRSATPRYRTRTGGLPLPPVSGAYELRIDWRRRGATNYTRDALSWPIHIAEQPTEAPRVTH
ncbi:MAG TPA: hypothetical protein VIV60_13920 [Polyangiaceae bacterium]